MRKRYGRKVDKTQKVIAQALRTIGCNVFEIEEPFDLLIDFRKQWFVMECKTKGTHARRKGGSLMTEKQEELLEIITATVLVAFTPEEAIELVTKSYEGTEI